MPYSYFLVEIIFEKLKMNGFANTIVLMYIVQPAFTSRRCLLIALFGYYIAELL